MQTCRPCTAGHCARPGGSRTSRQRLERRLSSPVVPHPPGHRLQLLLLLWLLPSVVHGDGDGRAAVAGGFALSRAAIHHLADFTRVPHLHLALGKPSGPGSPVPRRPTARWHHLEPADQPTRTCPGCTLHHTHGTTTQAWAYHPAHQRLCPRHHQWATPPGHRAPLNTRALPELAQAHHAHRRLTRRPNATTAYQWASSITTRWYDPPTASHPTLAQPLDPPRRHQPTTHRRKVLGPHRTRHGHLPRNRHLARHLARTPHPRPTTASSATPQASSASTGSCSHPTTC